MGRLGTAETVAPSQAAVAQTVAPDAAVAAEPAPAPAPKPQSVKARISAAIDTPGQSLDPAKMAKRLGITEGEAANTLSQMVSDGDTRLRQSKFTRKNPKTGKSETAGTRIQRQGFQKTPTDLFQAIAQMGGIQSVPELAKMDLPKVSPGIGPIAKKGGADPIAVSERMMELGYFGQAIKDAGVVPGNRALYDLIDKHARRVKVYSSNDETAVADRAEDVAAERADDEFEQRYGDGADGAARWGLERMIAAGALDADSVPANATLEEMQDAIDERIAMMGVGDIEAAIAAMDSGSADIIETTSEGAQDGDFTRGPVEEGGAPVERPAPGDTESEVDPGTEVESEGRPEPAREVEQAKPAADAGAEVDDLGAAFDEDADLAPRTPSPGTKLTSGIDPGDAIRMIQDTVKDIGKGLSHLSDKQIFAALKRTPDADSPAAQNPTTRLGAVNNWVRFGSGLAARNPKWARFFNETLARHATESQLIRSAEPMLRPLFDLSDAAQKRIFKIAEYDRLTATNRPRRGKRLVVVLRDDPTAQTRALSKAGETIELTEAETDAYYSMKKFLDDRWVQRHEAAARYFGYQGDWNKRAIEGTLANAKDEGEAGAAEKALGLWEMQEEGRRKGYIPFMRYGDKAIRIKPKPVEVPGKDATPSRYEDGGIWFVETEKPWQEQLDRKYDGGDPLKDKIAELKKKYPEDKYDWAVDDVINLADELDIPMIEKVFAAINAKDKNLGAKFYDDVMTQFYDEMRSGIYRESRNIPGYDPDFKRALGDYNRISASVIANMAHTREIEDAYQAVLHTNDQNLKDYADKYRKYVDSPSSDLAGFRQAGFFAQIWGSVSSAMVNLTQTPLVTTMQLAGWAGPARAAALANGALMSLSRPRALGGAVYFDKKSGLEIDWSRVGNTPAEKAAVKKWAERGLLSATLTQDLYGVDSSRFSAVANAKPFMEQTFHYGASAFDAAEKLNRAAAFLAYYRAAQNPAAMAKFKKMYKGDSRVTDMARREGYTPEMIAHFGVEETQFIPGKFDRPQLLRGWGGVAFQFKQYPANYMRLLIKNLSMQGREGKMAAAYMIGGIIATSGMGGLPFAADLSKLAEYLWEVIDEEDPQFQKEFREFVGTDTGLQRFAAEFALNGLGRMGPVDISRRLGHGELLPGDNLWTSIPLVSGTIMRFDEAAKRFHSGQDIGGVVAFLAPFIGKGPADMLRGFLQLPNEGYVTKRGKQKIFPGDITTAEAVMKFFGFQPSRFSQVLESDYESSRQEFKENAADRTLRTTLGRLYALASKEATAEDKKPYLDAARKRIKEAVDAGQNVPTGKSIRNSMYDALYPEGLKGMPKEKWADQLRIRELFPRQ